MCDSTFAFGQRGSHFLQCPSRREVGRLPSRLSALLASAQLRLVYHVALGFEDSFLITWCDKNGGNHIDSHNLPTELRQFLYARDAQQRLIRNIPHIRCSLGPYNSSFFAHDRNTYRWMNLPPSLLLALQDRIKDGVWTDQPRLVSLGADGNFVLITEKHAAIWNLQRYNTTAKLLELSETQKRGISGIQTIVLHAYRYGSFVTQSKNGTLIHENLPPHSTPALQAMAAPILQDTKALEWRSSARGNSEAKESVSRRSSKARESTPRGSSKARESIPRQNSEATENTPRRNRDIRESVPRRPSNLQQRAQLGREWSEHSQEITAQAKGVKLSLNLSVSINGIARVLR